MTLLLPRYAAAADVACRKVAASLFATSLAETLAGIETASRHVSLVEVRVDTLPGEQVVELVRSSPLPLIVTCRAEREGGRFAGTESERLAILRAAASAGAAFVDIEWYAERALALPKSSRALRLVSRHFADMPESLLPFHAELRPRADAVKLVGTARAVSDILPVLELLTVANEPVVALAMGLAGQLTRLLAVTFPACLLTYAALTSDRQTAPGQLTIEEMLIHHRLGEVQAGAPVTLRLCSSALVATEYQQWHRRTHRTGLDLVAVVPAPEAERLRAALGTRYPHWRVEVIAGDARWEEGPRRHHEHEMTLEGPQ